MNKISTKKVSYQKDIENDSIREKIRFNIEKNKKYNLRELSRTLKKNDAYLHQYIYRGTPRILPEEYRYKLAEILNVNINELTPSWLKKII